MTVIPSGAALGAEIQNVKLNSLSNQNFNEIHRTWLEYLVVRFHGQQLTLEDLVSFSRRCPGACQQK
jgi:taurine dioxygenase